MRGLVNKRGLSPIIATVLLISIALVLALIIFLWARNFVSEKVQKFAEPVENSCDKIAFEAEAYAGNINIVNRGNVALYAVEVRVKGAGSIGVMQFSESTIAEGESAKVPIVNALDDGAELVIIPLILGEAKGYKKAYTCDEKYGLPVTYTA
jgi:flagellin-like protein